MNTRPSSNSPNRSDLDTSTGHSPASDFEYAGSISASSSVDSSPAVIPKAIRRANSGSDDNHSPQRRTTPPYLQNNSRDRLSLEMGRPSSAAGKGGCWTCRLRRKKCDEIREGDSCQTCRRLQLKCLGWGPKRPEWMRDKDAVAQYKAEIKAHLLKLGLIRGQPRSNFIQTIPSTSTGSSAPPLSRHHSGGELQSSFRHDRHDQRHQITLSPHARGHSLGLGLGLGQEHSHGGMGHPEFGHGGVFGFEHTPPLDMNFPSNAVTDPHLFELTPTVASSGAAARALVSSNNNNSDVSAMSSAFDFPSTSMGSLSSLAGTNLPLSAATTPTGLLGFDTFSDEPRRQQQQQQQRAYHYDGLALRIPAGSGNDGGTVRRDHVVYYFDNVKGLQYLFSTKQAMDALYATLTEDPSHSLTDAVCAIASLHYNRTQPASLPNSTMNHPPDDTLAHFFHSQAAYPLTSISQRGLQSHITEYDVMTALHLVSYSLASVGGKVVNGSTGWGGMADFAIEWLTQTNLHLEDNPKEAMAKMSPSGAFAVRATMCIDIFMSITIRQPPRLLALYRRLLGESNSGNNGGNGWPSASHSRSSSTSSVFGAASVSRNNATSGTTSGVEQLIVCTDGVLLALAEMAALAHWKAQESRNSSLSVRELVARGNAIERSLSQHRDLSVDISLATFGDMHRDSAGMMLPPMRDGRTFEQQTGEEMSKKLVAAIWYEAAVMYLHSILSGPYPGVPEIANSANTVIHLLQRLPTTNLDRGLLLPLCIAGGLMDNQQQRMTVRNRLLGFGEDNVNVRQIVGLMLAVWQRRDSSGTMVDWRDVMQEQALALLLM